MTMTHNQEVLARIRAAVDQLQALCESNDIEMAFACVVPEITSSQAEDGGEIYSSCHCPYKSSQIVTLMSHLLDPQVPLKVRSTMALDLRHFLNIPAKARRVLLDEHADRAPFFVDLEARRDTDRPEQSLINSTINALAHVAASHMLQDPRLKDQPGGIRYSAVAKALQETTRLDMLSKLAGMPITETTRQQAIFVTQFLGILSGDDYVAAWTPDTA
jgi:hypothetical protein